MREEWRRSTLGETCRIRIGRTPPRKEARYWTEDLERPFCTIADMAGHRVNPSREGVTQAAESEGKAKRVPAGSLLMSFKLTIGRVGFAARDLFPNEAIAWLKSTKPGLDERFLALWLESQNLTEGAGRAVKGSTLNSDSLRAIPVLLPPLEVQLRIVDLITAIDDHITRIHAESTALSAAAEARRALFPQAEEVPLGAVLQGIDSGRSLGLNGSDEHATMRVLMLSAVRPAVFQPGEVKPLPADASMPEGALVREGDLLITRSNTPERVGYACRARDVQAGTFLPDLIWRLRLTPSCDADYLEQALASPLMRARVSGSAGGTSQSMRKINRAGLRTLLVPLPSLGEQRSYAAECLAIAGLSQAVAREADGLTVFRRQLLSGLLSREVEVSEAYDRLVEGVV